MSSKSNNNVTENIKFYLWKSILLMLTIVYFDVDGMIKWRTFCQYLREQVFPGEKGPMV